jgi:hypothetical protein
MLILGYSFSHGGIFTDPTLPKENVTAEGILMPSKRYF